MEKVFLHAPKNASIENIMTVSSVSLSKRRGLCHGNVRHCNGFRPERHAAETEGEQTTQHLNGEDNVVLVQEGRKEAEDTEEGVKEADDTEEGRKEADDTEEGRKEADDIIVNDVEKICRNVVLKVDADTMTNTGPTNSDSLDTVQCIDNILQVKGDNQHRSSSADDGLPPLETSLIKSECPNADSMETGQSSSINVQYDVTPTNTQHDVAVRPQYYDRWARPKRGRVVNRQKLSCSSERTNFDLGVYRYRELQRKRQHEKGERSVSKEKGRDKEMMPTKYRTETDGKSSLVGRDWEPETSTSCDDDSMEQMTPEIKVRVKVVVEENVDTPSLNENTTNRTTRANLICPVYKPPTRSLLSPFTFDLKHRSLSPNSSVQNSPLRPLGDVVPDKGSCVRRVTPGIACDFFNFNELPHVGNNDMDSQGNPTSEKNSTRERTEASLEMTTESLERLCTGTESLKSLCTGTESVERLHMDRETVLLLPPPSVIGTRMPSFPKSPLRFQDGGRPECTVGNSFRQLPVKSFESWSHNKSLGDSLQCKSLTNIYSAVSGTTNMQIRGQDEFKAENKTKQTQNGTISGCVSDKSLQISTKRHTLPQPLFGKEYHVNTRDVMVSSSLDLGQSLMLKGQSVCTRL